MTSTLRITIPQINVTVGDFAGNLATIKAATDQARHDKADAILFPELCITGYPPEDLLYRPNFLAKVEEALAQVRLYSEGLTVIVGAPLMRKGKLYNMAVVYQDKCLVVEYAKRCLPNYQVFDEKRYFEKGTKNAIIDIKGKRVGILVCEDIWLKKPLKQTAKEGIDIALVLNASPFSYGKTATRIALLEKRARKHNVPIVYTNMVGGQDELVYEGESLVVDCTGQLVYQAPSFESHIHTLDVPLGKVDQPVVSPKPSMEETVYNALVLGVRDYVKKNGFSGVLIGLSGGIDSALTLSIAVDALGADNVATVMMPFRYTADMSKEDAHKQAETLGVKHRTIPIETVFESFMGLLNDEFAGLARDTTEENIQARSRGVILMALSNKLGKMVLATGNKSEMSVGYATLYGDMAGGYAPLKDVYKLLVYRLARYVNEREGKEIIPNRVIERPPSAELAPDQVDQDSLPPYEILDVVLEDFIENLKSVDEIVADGYDAAMVKRVANMVLINEYKRRQAAPGVRITQRAFGKDRRYPITSHYRRFL